MKVQIISDLHVEVNGMPDPEDFCCDADIMIVAGDVGPAPSVVPVLKHISQHIKSPRNVFYVMGDHEAYGLDKTLNEVEAFLREEFVREGMEFLSGGSGAPESQGSYLIGRTLWTDFRLNDTFRNRRQQYYMEVARAGVNDYYRIKGLTPEGTANRSGTDFQNLTMLKGILDSRPAGTRIGVTHHLPTKHSIDPKYDRSPLNPAFASNYDSLLTGMNLWVHGHTHASCDYIHAPSGCRVICNPKGYGDENPDFNPKLVVEI